MKGFEGSAALCFLQRVGRGFLDASVGSYGSFAFLYGVLSAAVNLGFGNRSYLALGICVLLIVSSVPVLHFSRSLGAAICDSLVLGWFLFDVCGLSKEKLAVCERGNDKTRPAFLIAFVLGAVSRVITPLGLSCFIVTASLVTLLFCLPELGLCSLFLLLRIERIQSQPPQVPYLS
jgi:hypothetical protein